MAKKLAIEKVLEILASGKFDDFLGAVESEYLEFKSSPYQHREERAKMELAKDVSALANTNGGVVVIGIETKKDPTHAGDEARKLCCFAQKFADLADCQNLLDSWIYPPIRGLRLSWRPDAKNSSEGLVSIVVPIDANRGRPYVVVKNVDENGGTVGFLVGYFERVGERIDHMSASQLRDTLKDGMRFRELSDRLQSIEETLARHGPISPQSPSASSEGEAAVTEARVMRRVESARKAVGFERAATFYLACWPTGKVTFPTLFESRQESELVQLLEDPPKLGDAGFDLSMRRRSEILSGESRRVMAPDFKLLELWRDGALIFVTDGGDWHLCWATDSNEKTGLRINTTALTETTFLFCQLALRVYAQAIPQPLKLNFRLGLTDMSIGGVKCSLNMLKPDPYNFNLNQGRRPAPDDSGVVGVATLNSDPGMIAYELLSQLYNWFGFETTGMPYADTATKRIDPNQIRTR